ncbi:MAG: methyltransferase domain-containing protein [Chloroflexota bacterium]
MTKFDWENENGEQWLARVRDWEAMLKPIDAPIMSWTRAHLGSERRDLPLRVADMACGGGGTTFALESLLPESAVLHGFDISHAMVDVTQVKAQERGSRAKFFQVDLQTSKPPKETYDVLVSRFGTMFFLDPALSFKNIHKWLAPKGKFLFAVWGDLQQNPWSNVILDVARRFVDIPAPEPDKPGPFRYADLDLMLPLLKGAGFQNIQTEKWRGKLRMGGGMNVDTAADFAANEFAASDSLRKAGELAFSQAKGAMAEALSQYEVDGVVMMDAFVHLVSGSAD